MTLEQKYIEYLQGSNKLFSKIPFIQTYKELTEEIGVLPLSTSDLSVVLNATPNSEVLRALNIKQNNKTLERSIQSYQRAVSIRDVGRIRGNMEYLEDCWNVQIQPNSFKYAYLTNSTVDLAKEPTQSKIRDKYLKIRVRYDGTQYAIINAIKTKYIISYA